MNTQKKISMIRKGIDNVLLSICSLILLSLVVTVTWQVFSRYILNDPSSFTDELSRYLMIWLGLFGACYLFGKKGHLAITLLVDNLSGFANLALNIFINLVSLSFINLAMMKGGLILVSRTMSQMSPALDIPMAYVYFILPISAVLSTLYILLNVAELFTTNQDSQV